MSLNEFLKDSLGLSAIVINSNKLAMDYAAANQHETAMLLLQKAHVMLRQESKAGQDIKLKAITLNNIGCVYKRMGLIDKALTFLTEALTYQECLELDTLSLASTHLNLCAIYSHLSQHENALVHAMRALTILKQEKALNLNQALTLVIAFNNAAVEYEFLSQHDEACNFYYEGWECAVELLGRDHALAVKLLDSFQNLSSPTLPRERVDYTSKLRSARSPKVTPSRSRAPARDLVTFFDSFRRRRVKVSRAPHPPPVIPEEPVRSISNIRDYQHAAPPSELRSRLTPMRQPTKLQEGRKPPVKLERTMVLLGEHMEVLKEKMTRFEQSLNSGASTRRDLTSRQQIAFFSRRRQKAAEKVQAAFRGFKSRKIYLVKKQTVVALQCVFRKVLAKGVVTLKRANRNYGVVKIQALVRMAIVRKPVFQDLAARCIQQLVRRVLAIDMLQSSKRKVIRLQANVRRFLSRVRLLDYKAGLDSFTMKIQRVFYQYQARQRVLSFQSKTFHAVILLQTAFRTLLSQARLSEYNNILNQSQVCIQKVFKRKVARETVYANKVKTNRACSLIQAKFREFLWKKDIGRSMRIFRHVTQFLQKMYRGWKSRKEMHQVRGQIKLSSVTIQSVFRAWDSKVQCLRLAQAQFKATRRIQVLFRKFVAVRHVAQTKLTADSVSVCIQTRFRAMLSKVLVRGIFQRERHYSLQIQRIRRGYTARQTFKLFTVTLASSSLKIQRVLRRFIAQSSFKSLWYSRTASVLLIQKTYRMHRIRAQYLQKQSAAREIKKLYKAKKQKLEEETRVVNEFLSHMKSANALLVPPSIQPQLTNSNSEQLKIPPVVEVDKIRKIALIQAAVRGFNNRTQYVRRDSAKRIQQAFKCYIFRKGFLLSRKVKLLQTVFRRALVCEKYPEIRLWPAAIKVQASFRAFVSRQHPIPVTGVMKVQAKTRAFLARRAVKFSGSVLTVQKFTRMVILRNATRRSLAILHVQSVYRMFFERSRLLKYKKSVYIQCCLRRFFASQLAKVEKMSADLVRQMQQDEESRKQARQAAAVTIQKHYRRYVSERRYQLLQAAAVCVQKNWKMVQVRRIYRGVRNAALFIQDYYLFTKLKRRLNTDPWRFVSHSYY